MEEELGVFTMKRVLRESLGFVGRRGFCIITVISCQFSILNTEFAE